MQLRVSRPRVYAIKVAAQQPEEESERLRSRDSILKGSRHLPKKTPMKVVKGVVVGLSGVMTRLKDLRRGYS